MGWGARSGSGQAVFVGIVAVVCLIAVGFGVWSLATEARTEAAIAAAVILLALAQLAALLARLSGEERTGRSNRDMIQAAADMGREVREVRHRVGGIEDELSQDRQDGARQLGQQIAALERTVAGLAAQLQAHDPAIPGKPALAAAEGPLADKPEDEDGEIGDFSLFLQPIVRLTSGQTCYYRASHTPAGPGRETSFINRLVAVLRHLDHRGRAVGIFCPLAAAAFADARFLRRLVTFLRRNHDVAGKLVIEITQANLAGLSQRGMQGLAWLAELGATFSLAEASPDGPDLAALKDLGFQFVDLDLNRLPKSDRERRVALVAFAAAAEQHELTLMAGPFARPGDAARMGSAVSLGHGPLYARPRRVRPDIGDGAVPQAAAA